MRLLRGLIETLPTSMSLMMSSSSPSKAKRSFFVSKSKEEAVL